MCKRFCKRKEEKKKKEKNPTSSGAHDFMMIITDDNECADGRRYTDEFRAGRDVTDRPAIRLIVGSHFELHGYEYDADGTDLIVRVGTTVRVDQDGSVLAQSDDDEDVEIKIGDIDVYYPGSIERKPTNYFGIVWGRAYERLSGLADDEVDDEDCDYHAILYDIVIIGSNNTWGYEQWDDLYEGMKENLEFEN